LRFHSGTKKNNRKERKEDAKRRKDEYLILWKLAAILPESKR
jgi:hypothetical protein